MYAMRNGGSRNANRSPGLKTGTLLKPAVMIVATRMTVRMNAMTIAEVVTDKV
jgi:hypothetical protein